MITTNLRSVIEALHGGEVIAYPTESVFGLGCDPDKPAAISNLLKLKGRSQSKGLILIAAEFSQLAPYVDISKLNDGQRELIFSSWPGPVTWVLPASPVVSGWVCGDFETVAVRVSAHPTVKQLCQVFGKPITSTSANCSGLPPCRSIAEVKEQFDTSRLTCLMGETSGQRCPSEIRDGLTGLVLRQG